MSFALWRVFLLRSCFPSCSQDHRLWPHPAGFPWPSLCLSLQFPVWSVSPYVCFIPVSVSVWVSLSHSLSLSLSVSFPSLLLPLPSCQSLSHPSLSPASFFPSSLSLFSYLSFSCLSPPLALSPCFSIFATLHPFSLCLSVSASVSLCASVCASYCPPPSLHHITSPPLCLPVMTVPTHSPSQQRLSPVYILEKSRCCSN